MKVNIIADESGKLDGYINIGLTNFVDELNKAVEDGEADEIMLNESIGYFQLENAMDYLNLVIKKIRHGGKLIIRDVDAYEVSRQFMNLQISIEMFNILTHGNGKRMNLTCSGLSNYLGDRGYKVLKRRIDGFMFVVEVERP